MNTSNAHLHAPNSCGEKFIAGVRCDAKKYISMNVNLIHAHKQINKQSNWMWLEAMNGGVGDKFQFSCVSTNISRN